MTRRDGPGPASARVALSRVSFSNSTSPAMESVDVQEVPGDTYSYEVFLPQTPEQFEYDADGNLTLDGVWVYEWDAENRLKAMWMRPEVAAIRLSASSWVRLEFSYDYLGRRIAKKVLKGDGDTSWSVEKASQNMIWSDNKLEKFCYDGWTPVAAYESSLVDNSFIRFTGSWAWGPDLSGTLGGAGGIGGLAIATDDLWDNEHPSNGVGPTVPVYDGNGNIQRLLRALDREVVAKYEYGPFGETRSIDGPLGQHNPFRWSTKYTDSETGLVYYGYRYYSAGLGRWLSKDPIEEHDGANSLAYLGNSPSIRVDPLGLWHYIPKMGLFEGQFGPTSSARWGSQIELRFVPNDRLKCRGTCKQVRFVQIYVAHKSGTLSISSTGGIEFSSRDLPRWIIDADDGPEYPYYPHDPPWGDPTKGASSTMNDTPELGITGLGEWLPIPFPILLPIPISYEHRFETCAICSSGPSRGDIYGCIGWGHYFSGRLAFARSWVRWFDSTSMSLVWASSGATASATQWHEDGTTTRYTVGPQQPTLVFSKQIGLEPSELMKFIVLDGRY